MLGRTNVCCTVKFTLNVIWMGARAYITRVARSGLEYFPGTCHDDDGAVSDERPVISTMHVQWQVPLLPGNWKIRSGSR